MSQQEHNPIDDIVIYQGSCWAEAKPFNSIPSDTLAAAIIDKALRRFKFVLPTAAIHALIPRFRLAMDVHRQNKLKESELSKQDWMRELLSAANGESEKT